MGRKIELKKIDDLTKRQITFSKRCSHLYKKSKEISICCDTDVLFVALSPSGRLNKFSGQKRIEEMLIHYTSLPVERRLSHMENVQEKVAKLRQLNHIKGDVSKLHFLDKKIENLELQMKKSTLELQIVNANIRDYEPGYEQEPSLHQLVWCERNLQLSLQKAMARKMELEKQGKIDVHFMPQQIAPQQFDTNNWINPYSSNIQGSMYQDHWMDKGKRVANSSSNYAYTPSFASNSQFGNISYSPVQNLLPYIPLQSQQQNVIIDVQQNQAQTFGQSQNMMVNVQQNQAQTFGQSQTFEQSQNMMVNVQQNQAQTFGQSQAQLTFGESSDNSIKNFWYNVYNSTRPISSPLTITDTELNNPFQLGLENTPSALNNSINDDNNNSNNNNHPIIQNNDHSSVLSDAIAPNVSGFNYSMEEDTNMGNNEYFAEKSYDNDAWELDDDFLNEIFNGEEFRSLD